MTTAHPTDEADIRQRIDKLASAIRAGDLEAVMSAYSPDVVSFDIESPLQHVGLEAKRKNWERVFTVYESPWVTRSATSPSLWAKTWLLRTALIGSAAR
jgi:ketosteroid isomerase-like protein